MKEQVPYQEEVMSKESKAILQAGIPWAKAKQAIITLVRELEVTDALMTTHTQIDLHWMLYDQLKNWLRAEFPRRRFGRWPWGNWWHVRVWIVNQDYKGTDFGDPVKLRQETRSLVIPQ